MHLRHTGAGSSSSSSSAAASEAAAVLDKLIAAAAAAASITSSLGSSSSSSGDADSEAVAATPGGRELLTGALAVVRYHRATAPHEVRAAAATGCRQLSLLIGCMRHWVYLCLYCLLLRLLQADQGVKLHQQWVTIIVGFSHMSH
jgi:hypothetical protein